MLILVQIDNATKVPKEVQDETAALAYVEKGFRVFVPTDVEGEYTELLAASTDFATEPVDVVETTAKKKVPAKPSKAV